MTAVKICGLSEWTHVRTALSAGASMLGFVFYPPSHRRVSPEQARDLVARGRAEFGSGWGAVGLFVNESPDRVEQVMTFAGLDLAQLSGDEDLHYCRDFPLPFIKVVRPERLDADGLGPACDRRHWGAERVLLDSHVGGRYGGTGATLPWSLLRRVAGDCLLAGGLTPANVGEAVRLADPWGVDVSSGVERERQKDVDLIRAFIEEVQRVDERAGV